jgi:Tfp pilus assembly protein PilN
MANLLPRDERKYVQRERAMRISIVGLIFLLTIVVFANVLLAPSYFLAYSRESEVREQIETIERVSALREDAGASLLLKSTKDQLSFLKSALGVMLPRELIEEVLISKPRRVSVTSILYTTRKDGDQVTLRGLAESRDDLIRFSANLEDSRLFSDVQLPVSNLAQSTDVSFELNVYVAATQE